MNANGSNGLQERVPTREQLALTPGQAATICALERLMGAVRTEAEQLSGFWAESDGADCVGSMLDALIGLRDRYVSAARGRVLIPPVGMVLK